MKLLPKERKILYLKNVSILWYNWIIFRMIFNQKCIVTNKRIIFRWPVSYFYDKRDYEKYRTWGTFIMKYETGKGKFFGNYIKFMIGGWWTTNIKIYTDKNKQIAKIIKNSYSRLRRQTG